MDMVIDAALNAQNGFHSYDDDETRDYADNSHILTSHVKVNLNSSQEDMYPKVLFPQFFFVLFHHLPHLALSQTVLLASSCCKPGDVTFHTLLSQSPWLV